MPSINLLLIAYFFLGYWLHKLGNVMASKCHLVCPFVCKLVSILALLVIFFLHEALLIADLASEKEWYFWTWVIYFDSAIVTFLLPCYIFEEKHRTILFWLSFHGTTTLASAIAYYASGNNTSDLVPSLKLGQVLAHVIPMPAKDLSIIGTTFILILVSILACVKNVFFWSENQYRQVSTRK